MTIEHNDKESGKGCVRLQRAEVLGSEIFPIETEPMEDYMLWTAAAGFQNTFRISIELTGVLYQPHFFDAFEIAVRRHAILCATLSSTRNRNVWYLKDSIEVEFGIGYSYDEHPFGMDWNLSKSVGCRFWLKQESDGCEITFEFHHASTDGQGAQQLIHDIFEVYHRLREGVAKEEVKLKTMDPRLLAERGHFRRKEDSVENEKLGLWKKLELACRFHFLLPDAVEDSRPSSGVGEQLSRWVVDRQLRSMTENAMRTAGVNLTEWTSYITLRAIRRFKEERNEDCSRIRLMLPTSHRTYEDKRMPACNRISFSFVTLEKHQFDTENGALQTISKQVKAIRRYQLGLDFIEQLAAVFKMRWIAKTLVRWDRSWTTAIVSSLGDIGNRVQRLLPKSAHGTRTGDVHISRVFGFPPIRRRCNIAVGVCQQGEEIFLGLRSFLSKESAEQFRAIFIEEWKQESQKNF